MSQDTTPLTKSERKDLGYVANLFLQMRVSDENVPQQGNNGRIDGIVSESRCPKLHKIDRKLSKMTES